MVAGLAPKEAHESGDGVTIRHCPFCGSGQVIGRSDGNTECSFCNSAFLVRVQPMYSAFPQSIGGMPVQIPGMPPPSNPMGGGMQPGVPGEDGEDGGNPFADGGSEEDPAETTGGSAGSGPPSFGGSEGGKGSGGSEENDSGPPSKKESFRSTRGAMGREAYLAYLVGRLQ